MAPLAAVMKILAVSEWVGEHFRIAAIKGQHIIYCLGIKLSPKLTSLSTPLLLELTCVQIGHPCPPAQGSKSGKNAQGTVP